MALEEKELEKEEEVVLRFDEVVMVMVVEVEEERVGMALFWNLVDDDQLFHQEQVERMKEMVEWGEVNEVVETLLVGVGRVHWSVVEE